MTSMRFPAILRRRAIATLGLFLLLSVGGALHAQSSAQTAPAATNNTAATNSAKQTTLSETDKYRLSAPVVKFGAALGMKPETAANVFTIFNILILIAGVGYGLLKILPKTFRDRSTAIQKHLVDARTATEEATTRLSTVEERLSQAG